MRRLGRVLAVVSWLTIFAMAPIPWQQLIGALRFPLLPTVAWMHPAAATAGTIPAERVVPLQAGGLSAAPDRDSTPRFGLSFSDEGQQGPGLTAGIAQPGEPLLEVEMRLKHVGAGFTPRQTGRARTFDIPASGGPAPALQSALFLPTAATPPATTTTTSPTATTAPATATRPASTTTPTPATGQPATTPAATSSTVQTPLPTATSAATGTPAGALTPAPSNATGTPTLPSTVGPSSGNRYAARMALQLEPAADERSIKETLVFQDRPATNTITWAFRLRGLTPLVQPDGSIRLRDERGQHVMTVPAPVLTDARGQRGAARYVLGPEQLDVVLDAAFVASAALPLTLDPTLDLVDAAGLWENAPASWQRQSVVARDGTQVFCFYDTTTGSRGIKVRTSPDGFASATTLTSPTLVVEDDQGGGSTWPIGASGFAVEIDQGADVDNRTLFDRVYVAVTGKSGSQTNVLRIHTLSRDASGTYAVDATPLTVASNSGGLSGPTWSGATLAIERESQVGTDGQGNPILKDYLWVGADEKGTNGKYTYKTWQRELLTDGTLDPAGWTASTPTLVADESTPHYAALVALTGGVAVVGTTQNHFMSTTYPRGGAWESLTQIRFKPPFLNKTYSVIAVTDPLSPDNERFVPLVVLLPVDEQENTKTDVPEYYARRYDPNQSQGLHLATAWDRLKDDEGHDIGGSKESYSPQLTWDGTSFYCFYLAKVTNNERSISGKRGQLGDTAGTLVLEAERTWIKEQSPNKLLKWLGVPRALTSDIVPFFYIADKSVDSFFVQAKRVLMLGDRAQWQYQEIPVPGAGTLKVNLANGNLFYTMTDASFSARGWDDEITRSYNSQSTFVSPFGPGWNSLASPRLEFYNSKKDRLEKTLAAGVNRINYYAPDGSQYLYSSQRDNTGATNWLPELGLTMRLEQILLPVDEKRFKLTDNDGNIVYFNKAGRPVFKQDVDPPGATNHRAWEWPNMGVTGTDISSIVNKVTPGQGSTVTGRTQAFTLTTYGSEKRATQITVSGFGDSQVFKYEYDTTASKRLTAAKLAYQQGNPPPSDQLTISYGYYDAGTSKDKLKTITVPASSGNTNPSVYTIFYFPDGKVQAIKLPNPSPSATDDPNTACGTTGCWLFDYQEGEGLTTVTGPRGATNGGTWAYHVFGSGPAYQITDPAGNQTDQSWSTHFNKISVTRPVGGQTATTQYEYDENRNRTKIVDPLNDTTDFEYYPRMDGNIEDLGRYNRRKSKTEAKVYPDQTRAKTSYDYKANGVLDKLTDPAQQHVDIDEDGSDMYRIRNRYSQTDASNHGLKHQLWTHFEYDDNGTGLVSEEVRKERTADNVNTWQFLSKTSYTRDAWGRVTQERVGAETADNTNDRMTVTAYDHLGRATSARVRMAAANRDSTQNDPPGQRDLITLTTYNPDGTIKQVVDPAGGVTDYRYDRRGRVVGIEGPLPTAGSGANDRPCKTFEYDEVGNQIAVRAAVSRSGTTTCTYPKPAGETGTIVWSETDRTYDKLNQQTAEELQTGSDPNYGGKIRTQWSYDPAGRVTGIREPNSTDPDPNAPSVTFEYDKLGRKTKEQRTVTLNGSAQAFQRCWEYDA
ncbi:MAG: hypothetical protein IT307_15325, partial [Chloroflexi bacterium]|nr:hypothetical protein [Chloroflexota bacterium]